VTYHTVDGTAVSPKDYSAIAANTNSTICAGATSERIDVTVAPDTIYEQPDEQFYVDITAAVTALSAASVPNPVVRATVTIVDPNVVPSVGFTATALAIGEGTSAVTGFLTLALSHASSQPVTVTYGTTTTPGTATQGADYVQIASSMTAVIAPETLTVQVTRVPLSSLFPLVGGSCIVV
jgi:hypothetical protein